MTNYGADGEVDSPCINLCRIDDTTGWCRGCRRTIREVMNWPKATSEERRAILAELPNRKL